MLAFIFKEDNQASVRVNRRYRVLLMCLTELDKENVFVMLGNMVGSISFDIIL